MPRRKNRGAESTQQRKQRKPKTAAKPQAISFTDLDGKRRTITPLQYAWCTAFLGKANFNRTEATWLAGYMCGNNKIAADVGSKNIGKPDVRAYLDKKLDEAGYNDAMANRELLLAMRQTEQWGPKVSALREYNELKGRKSGDDSDTHITVIIND